jgi:hypothetical protein
MLRIGDHWKTIIARWVTGRTMAKKYSIWTLGYLRWVHRFRSLSTVSSTSPLRRDIQQQAAAVAAVEVEHRRDPRICSFLDWMEKPHCRELRLPDRKHQ